MSEEEKEWEIVNYGQKMPQEVKERMEVIQSLMAFKGTGVYGKKQQEAALKLGISQRSVQRLLKNWREKGVKGLSRQVRSDRGQQKTTKEWQKFILKTYKEGNGGSRQMSRAQVYVRVKVRAQELGVEEYPSRSTVYRLLEWQGKGNQKKKHSIGWRGEGLNLKTAEGLELSIEWSNQVWQCDHTKVDVLVVGQAGEIIGRPWLTTVIDS